jgi:hypothetical protein
MDLRKPYVTGQSPTASNTDGSLVTASAVEQFVCTITATLQCDAMIFHLKTAL